MEQKRYVYSSDGEDFSHDTEEEAMEVSGEDVEEGEECTYWKGVATHVPTRQLISPRKVVSIIADNAYIVAGDWAEDYPCVSAGAKEELHQVLCDWIDKHCPPHFYLVKEVEEIKFIKKGE